MIADEVIEYIKTIPYLKHVGKYAWSKASARFISKKARWLSYPDTRTAHDSLVSIEIIIHEELNSEVSFKVKFNRRGEEDYGFEGYVDSVDDVKVLFRLLRLS